MIHCPKCSIGTLKIIKPTIENGWTKFYNSKNNTEQLIHIGEIKPDEVFTYCERCGHYHIMKEHNFRNPINKPKRFKIKGYGTYHY